MLIKFIDTLFTNTCVDMNEITGATTHICLTPLASLILLLF